MRAKIQSEQPGVVALITTIVVGLLLVVVTSAAVAIMGTEISQSSDYNQGVVAYFAAESGAEDAVNHIRNYLANNPGDYAGVEKTGCTPYGGVSAGYLDNNGGENSEYTCQQVIVAQNSVTDHLGAEATNQVDLSGANNLNNLNLAWNQESSGDPQWTQGTIPAEFPPGTKWADKFPAVMEVTFISYPRGRAFSSNEIQTSTAVLKPVNGGGVASVDPFNPGSQPVPITCTPSNGGSTYDCSVTFDNLDSNANNYVVQIRARYSGAYYNVSASASNGDPTQIPNAEITIDSTGKAGDVLRRVVLHAPISGGLPNFVILSNDTICKVFTVQAGHASSEPGCDAQ